MSDPWDKAIWHKCSECECEFTCLSACPCTEHPDKCGACGAAQWSKWHEDRSAKVEGK